MPENVFILLAPQQGICWQISLSDEQPHYDYNGQWQRALCMVVVLQGSQLNPQRNWEWENECYRKQIKISAEYRDMPPRPELDLSGTPGLWPIGLRPGSWLTSLGLGSMSFPVFCTDLNLYSYIREQRADGYSGYFQDLDTKSNWLDYFTPD